MKVKFKPKVKKMIEAGLGEWVEIIVEGGYSQSYDTRFLETEYIEIDAEPIDFNKNIWVNYDIINPPHLREYSVTKGHIIPYKKEYEITLDDELFEL